MPQPRPRSGLLATLLPEEPPLDMRILGRTLLQAAVVGAAAGLIGAAFFASLELVQRLLLENAAGFHPLRAAGERFLGPATPTAFRPLVLLLLPAVGGLISGLLTWRFAPEARGGGGDATIEAYHHQGAVIRPRVLWVKALASVFTLGAGGSGGREGPTMQIGGALGSLTARLLGRSARERRVLLVAGVAAGISAVFRTPLGAALLAVEFLYRDDFETDAVVPSVLASVVAYSVVISIFGESTLFAHAPRYPFVPAHLPLYGLLAVLVALFAAGFLAVLRWVQRTTRALRLPEWSKPAMGGLALGIFAVPVILIVGAAVGVEGYGLGLLGGGYGAAQLAITGGSLLPAGWSAVEILVGLACAKAIATSLTIGSGGSAGDFAPSLVLGALLGGAFGRAVGLLLGDPAIDPGAFALVGMGAFYGGLAKVPLAALVLVCELAGSYDLLVPLMLAVAIASVALRHRSLYLAQPATRRDSPAHRDALALDALAGLKVREIMETGRAWASFQRGTPAAEVVRRVSDLPWQDVFPVVGEDDAIVGVITSEGLRILAGARELEAISLAADVMQPAVTARIDEDARSATHTLLAAGLPQIPVVDERGQLAGFLGESEIAQAYVKATAARG